MIARLKGFVQDKSTGFLVVDVNGVGYEVHAASGLIDEVEVGEEVSLSIYTHVREQSLELFGFSTSTEKELFLKLIGVSGVGPKMGMTLIGLSDDGQLRQAIANEDVAFLTQASGVGKRLAEKVIVDLKDKVGVVAGSPLGAGFTEKREVKKDDALEALVALGFTRQDAAERLQQVDQALSVEDRVKQALVREV